MTLRWCRSEERRSRRNGSAKRQRRVHSEARLGRPSTRSRSPVVQRIQPVRPQAAHPCEARKRRRVARGRRRDDPRGQWPISRGGARRLVSEERREAGVRRPGGLRDGTTEAQRGQRYLNHRDTENTEIFEPPRHQGFIGVSRLRSRCSLWRSLCPCGSTSGWNNDGNHSHRWVEVALGAFLTCPLTVVRGSDLSSVPSVLPVAKPWRLCWRR